MLAAVDPLSPMRVVLGDDRYPYSIRANVGVHSLHRHQLYRVRLRLVRGTYPCSSRSVLCCAVLLLLLMMMMMMMMMHVSTSSLFFSLGHSHWPWSTFCVQVWNHLMGNGSFWLVTLVLIALLLGIDMFSFGMRRNFFFNNVNILQEVCFLFICLPFNFL